MCVIYLLSAVSILGEVFWLCIWLESVRGNSKLRDWMTRSPSCIESLSKASVYTKDSLEGSVKGIEHGAVAAEAEREGWSCSLTIVP